MTLTGTSQQLRKGREIELEMGIGLNWHLTMVPIYEIILT